MNIIYSKVIFIDKYTATFDGPGVMTRISVLRGNNNKKKTWRKENRNEAHFEGLLF